jgi:hypothetical protein
MNSLYCKLGDLAITVKAHNIENIGKVVKIIGVEGFTSWPDINGKIFVWIVESATQGVKLKYENADSTFSYANGGQVPDDYLRPIVRSRKKNHKKVIKVQDHEFV